MCVVCDMCCLHVVCAVCVVCAMCVVYVICLYIHLLAVPTEWLRQCPLLGAVSPAFAQTAASRYGSVGVRFLRIQLTPDLGQEGQTDSSSSDTGHEQRGGDMSERGMGVERRLQIGLGAMGTQEP